MEGATKGGLDLQNMEDKKQDGDDMLLNSLELEINQNCLFYNTAEEL